MVWRILATFACFTVWSAIAIAEEPLRISGRTMGSYYAITIDEPGGADAARLQRDIEQLLSELNRQMSTWDDASQISQFNRLVRNLRKLLRRPCDCIS
jgi:thiamine biosynthesis lipoprotein ApbE